jgi:hypothetical protein
VVSSDSFFRFSIVDFDVFLDYPKRPALSNGSWILQGIILTKTTAKIVISGIGSNEDFAEARGVLLEIDP